MTNKDNFQLTLTPADTAEPAFLDLVEEADELALAEEEEELSEDLVVLTEVSEEVEATEVLVYVEVTEEAATLPVETKLEAVCLETEEEEEAIFICCVY